MKVPEAAKNLLVLLVATGLCLVGAELFLRSYLPGNPVIYQLDGACLYKLTPGSRKVFRHFKVNRRESVVVEINSLGFRGDELASREHDARRIVVYGDSFIEAEFSPLDQTFVGQLDRKLNERGLNTGGRPAVQVVNAGVIGYGPDQIVVRMQTELASLKPDLVIVALCSGNDFGDLLRDKIYRLGEGNRLVRNAFVLDWRLASQLARVGAGDSLQDGALIRSLRKLHWDLSRFIERSGLPEQAAGEDLVEWSLRACLFEYEDYVLKRHNTVVNLFNDHYDADVSLLPESESAHYKVNLMAQVVRRIKEVADSQSVPLLLLLIPDAIDVEPGHHFKVKPESLEGHHPSRPTDVLQAIAASNKVSCVNLFPTFRKNRPASLYFRDPETHWNAAGQQLAAQAVVDELQSSGWLVPTSSHPKPAE